MSSARKTRPLLEFQTFLQREELDYIIIDHYDSESKASDSDYEFDEEMRKFCLYTFKKAIESAPKLAKNTSETEYSESKYECVTQTNGSIGIQKALLCDEIEILAYFFMFEVIVDLLSIIGRKKH